MLKNGQTYFKNLAVWTPIFQHHEIKGYIYLILEAKFGDDPLVIPKYFWLWSIYSR